MKIKAFDRVHHSSLFECLIGTGLEMGLISVLRRLYRGLRAYVKLWPGAESREFQLQRGVRQGDPLSPVLFNVVMTEVLAEVDRTWQRRGYGTMVGREDRGQRLTRIAFADDVPPVS